MGLGGGGGWGTLKASAHPPNSEGSALEPSRLRRSDLQSTDYWEVWKGRFPIYPSHKDQEFTSQPRVEANRHSFRGTCRVRRCNQSASPPTPRGSRRASTSAKRRARQPLACFFAGFQAHGTNKRTTKQASKQTKASLRHKGTSRKLRTPFRGDAVKDTQKFSLPLQKQESDKAPAFPRISWTAHATGPARFFTSGILRPPAAKWAKEL